MKYSKWMCPAAVILFALVFAIPVFAQQVQTAAPAAAPAKETEAPAKAEDLTIYGEVKSANQAAGSLTVQYYDYDSDEEKTAEIIANKDTKLEGAAAVGDIKQGDWVDVTYAAADGKNLAKSITVEKEEAQGPAGEE